MSIIPDPREAQELRRLFAGNVIVTVAVNALEAFGLDLDADTAAKLLPMWRYNPELSDRERRAVLARFVPEPEAGPLPYDRDDAHPQPGDPAPPLPAGVDGFPVTGRVEVELGEGNSGPGGAL